MGAREVVERDTDRVVVRLRGDSSCARRVLEVCGLADLLVAGHAPMPTPGRALNVAGCGRA
jgi:hypothetical protein